MDNHRIFNLKEICQYSLISILIFIIFGLIAVFINLKEQYDNVEIIELPLDTVKQDTVDSISIDTPIKISKVISHVHMTCYQPVKSQCNNDPLHTADGSKIDLKKLKNGKLKWIAISRDIEYMFPMGSKVRLIDEKTGKDYGIYEVKDRMNKRWKHRIDILIHPSSKERISKENIRIELI